VLDPQVMTKKLTAETAVALNAFSDRIAGEMSLTAPDAKAVLEEVTVKLGIKTGQVLQVLRVSLTGESAGPDLMMTMEILGGAESARRIKKAMTTHASKVA
jgi:glutamyl-tRNA synthetase